MTRSLTTYVTGLVLSLGLTLLPLLIIWLHGSSRHTFLSHETLYVSFALFAVLQLLVQLYFFLHLGEESRPRWNLMALCFALLIVSIVVGGTLWIMYNLSHGQSTELPFIKDTITPQASND